MINKIVDHLTFAAGFVNYKVSGKIGEKWLVTDYYGTCINNDHVFTEEELVDYINRNNYPYSYCLISREEQDNYLNYINE